MALFSCPRCGIEVSDEAKKCVHCGVAFGEDAQTCHECGEILENGAVECQKCGAPAAPSWKRKLRSRKFIVISIIFAVVILGIVFEIVRTNVYERRLAIIAYMVLENTVKAEECGNLIQDVWYNNIFKKSDRDTDLYTKDRNGRGAFYEDFNVALDNLFDDNQFKQKINYLRQDQEEVAAMMKKMKFPPLKWRNAYKTLLKYYDAYLEFADLIIHPTGSLQEFSDKTYSADLKIANLFDRMVLYLTPAIQK